MIRQSAFLEALLVTLAMVGCAGTPEPSVPAADYVFTNGKVYTVDEANSWAEAVAVRGNEGLSQESRT